MRGFSSAATADFGYNSGLNNNNYLGENMRSPFLRLLTAAAVVMSIWSGTMAQSVAFDTSRMDRSANACDDFFEFANGNWVKNTPIPPSQSRWGSLSVLAEGNRDVLHGILERAAADKNAK